MWQVLTKCLEATSQVFHQEYFYLQVMLSLQAQKLPSLTSLL
jgi:hypothetical protein